MQEFRSGGVR